MPDSTDPTDDTTDDPTQDFLEGLLGSHFNIVKVSHEQMASTAVVIGLAKTAAGLMEALETLEKVQIVLQATPNSVLEMIKIDPHKLYNATLNLFNTAINLLGAMQESDPAELPDIYRNEAMESNIKFRRLVAGLRKRRNEFSDTMMP